MNAFTSLQWTKTLRGVLLLAVMLLGAVGPCFALRSVGIVTPKEAKEMGIVIRATASGPEAVWIELEFKPEGQLKSFQHVELDIRDGEKPLVAYAMMKETRTTSGSVVVRFMASRTFLDKITLIVVTGFPSAYANNELRVKEFVDLEKIR